ncbi:MAG: hypothetical protein RUMPE_01314 [Eubacteriales bacterium SKADARSKE-1]|nr:hypothetical protein [Eubacteriales bacterium SKADARSKE-1]
MILYTFPSDYISAVIEFLRRQDRVFCKQGHAYLNDLCKENLIIADKGREPFQKG